MAENKQYITQIQEGGNVMISEDVVATIVEHTLTEVEGVVKGGSEVVGKKSWGKGLRISIAEDNSVSIGCNVIVSYGESVVDVAKAVQESVTTAVESVTPLLQLKKFPDIHVSTREEAGEFCPHPEEPRFCLLAREEGSFPTWSGKISLRFRRISRGGALHRKGD